MTRSPPAADRPNRPPGAGTSFAARGGWWVIAQMALMAAVGLAGAVWKDHWPGLFSRPVGLGLLGLGAVMGGTGAVQLGGGLTPFPKPLDHSRLVQQGVYGLVRHPLYCSVILASLGWALLRASLPALSLVVVLGVFLNAKADHEEACLRERYPEYDAYAARVQKLLPFIF